MTDWFRSWHGAPTDPKWLVVARKAGVVPGVVSAVVWALFDHASQQDDRGDVRDFDVETFSAFSGFEETDVHAVIAALREKGIIADGKVAYFKGKWLEDLRPPSRVWVETRKRIFKRDDYTCAYCGERGSRLECDHVVPLSRGGSNSDDNLAAACKPCNRNKRDKLLEEWQPGRAS